MIEELDSSAFTYDNYETNYWSRLNLTWDVLDEPFLKALKTHAIGYCRANYLPFRPRFGYAIMCEDEDFEKFWFHISEDLFNRLIKEKENAKDEK